MEQEITVINGSEWTLWLYLTGVCVIVAVVAHLITKYYLLKGAEEFDDCQREARLYIVNGDSYSTYLGARNRCTYLYKRFGYIESFCILYDDQDKVILDPIEYFKLTR